MDNKDLFCGPRHNKAGRFVEACLLNLLKEEKSYGYSLMERLAEFGLDEDSINISIVYRRLRNMEKDNLVVSSWSDSDQGPKKRMYQITDQGLLELDNWILLLKDRKKRITSIIEKYDSLNDLSKGGNHAK